LKIETQHLDDHQVKLTVEVEPDSVDTAKRKAARHIAQRTKIPGFRPGKAPYQVVLRQYGEAAIIEDAIEHLIDDIYPLVIEEAGIKPYGPGKLENVTSMDPMVLEFIVPLQAEVTLGDYSNIRVPYAPPETSQEAIDELLGELRERQAVLEPVERPAQSGDVVSVHIRGERMSPEEGQNPVITEEMPASMLVQDESALPNAKEWPYPGFSVNLMGVSAGDEITVEHVLPDNLEFKDLRGVAARFFVRVEDVKSRTLPELDEDFAQMVSDKDNMEALIEDIRRMLDFQGQQDYLDEYDSQVLDAAVELTNYKYPPQLIENEIDQFIENFKRRLNAEEMDFDLYLKARNTDLDGLREEVRPDAEKRARRSLMLFEIARVEDFQLNRGELQKRTSQTINQMTRNLSKKDARKFYDSGVFQNVVSNIMADMLSVRAVEHLRAIASDGAYTPPPNEETGTGKVAKMQDLLIDGPEPENAPVSDAEPVVEEHAQEPVNETEPPVEDQAPESSETDPETGNA